MKYTLLPNNANSFEGVVGGGGPIWIRIQRKENILFLILVSSFLVCLCYQYSENVFKKVGLPHSVFKSWKIKSEYEYLVETPGCKIIELEPFSSAVDLFWIKGPGKRPKCNGTLVRLVNQSLIIDGAVLARSREFAGVRCCFRSIRRVQQGPENYTRKADALVQYGEECTDIPTGSEGIEVKEQYLKVVCRSETNVTVFDDFHPVIIAPELLSNSTKTKAKYWQEKSHNNGGESSANKDLPPSVLIIGIDSTSRLHMKRSMPKTKDFLVQNDFIEMKGYTKVGINTFPNLIAILGGMTENELKKCWPTKHSKLDDCNFIWKNFSRLNYLTSFVEDYPSIGNFNYLKTGFVSPPVDYYLRPVMMAEYNFRKNLKGKSSTHADGCIGGDLNPTELLMQYIRSFISNVGRKYPYFLLSWFTSIFHDSFNGLKEYDTDFRDFLNFTVKQNGENTLIFFISDHGYRHGQFRATYQGFCEGSLPFFFIRIPPSLKSRFPKWFENLQINSNRLTSPHDLYSTLIDIHNFAKNLSIGDATIAPTKLTLGKRFPSFFELGLINRTCESSLIPQQFCVCGATPKVTQSDEMNVKMANLIINVVNSVLGNYTKSGKCVELSLSKIHYGREAGSGEVRNNFQILVPYKDYAMGVISFPGDGQFEARIRVWTQKNFTVNANKSSNHVNGDMELLGEVSRIDSYEGKSDCMDDYVLRNYCLCKDYWDKEKKKEEAKKAKAKKKKSKRASTKLDGFL